MEQRRGRNAQARPAGETIAVVGRRLPAVPTRTFLRMVARPRMAWATADATVVAGGAVAELTADGPDRFGAIRDAATSLLDRTDRPGRTNGPGELPAPARPRLFGGFAFHAEYNTPADGPWQGYPGALFVLPAVQLTRAGGEAWLTAAASGPDAHEQASGRLERWSRRLACLPTFGRTGPPGIRRRRPTPDRKGWRAQVESALDQIADGALRKVVLAQSLAVDLRRELVVPDALSRLASTYPGCTRFLFEPAGAAGSFFGATPERLVSRRGRTVQTTVLAGSTGRGDTAAEDAWLADQLRESDKDRHEHAVVRDAVREQLAPLAATVEPGDRGVRRLATVQHLETPVRARLDRDRHVLEVVEALHPTPAVGGMPQDAALRTIGEHETFDRGWYAAPVGWIDGEGDGTFAVALRSALAEGDAATLFAGAGIVGDSDPDREWDELQLKYRPILDELA